VIGSPFYSAGYSQFAADRYKFKYTVVNNEPSTPISCGMTQKDFQPSVGLTTYQLALNSLLLAPATGVNGVGEASGQSVYRSPWYQMPIASVLGNPRQYLSEKDFSGNWTSGVTQKLWNAFVILGPVTANVSCVLTLNIAIRARFYSISPNAL